MSCIRALKEEFKLLDLEKIGLLGLNRLLHCG